jgi:hypothetical protein
MTTTVPLPPDLATGLAAYIEVTRTALAAIDLDITILETRRQVLTAHLRLLEGVGNKSPAPAVSGGAPPVLRRKPWRRAPTGSWARAVHDAAASHGGRFTYRQLQAAAQALGIAAPMASVRVRVSKFKTRGFIAQVSPGTYELVP